MRRAPHMCVNPLPPQRAALRAHLAASAEFCVALHVAARRFMGAELPDQLPPQLVPPKKQHLLQLGGANEAVVKAKTKSRFGLGAPAHLHERARALLRVSLVAHFRSACPACTPAIREEPGTKTPPPPPVRVHLCLLGCSTWLLLTAGPPATPHLPGGARKSEPKLPKLDKKAAKIAVAAPPPEPQAATPALTPFQAIQAAEAAKAAAANAPPPAPPEQTNPLQISRSGQLNCTKKARLLFACTHGTIRSFPPPDKACVRTAPGVLVRALRGHLLSLRQEERRGRQEATQAQRRTPRLPPGVVL